MTAATGGVDWDLMGRAAAYYAPWALVVAVLVAVALLVARRHG